MIGGLGTQNNSFSVRQVYNGKRYTIETNTTTSLSGKIMIIITCTSTIVHYYSNLI